MTEDDRRHAREVLERKWLSIEEVTSVREAVEKTGMPFLEAARAKGLLTTDRVRELTQPAAIATAPPPPPAPKRPARKPGIPILYATIMILAAAVIIGSDIYFRIQDRKHDRLLQQQEAEMRQKADQEAALQQERIRAAAVKEERDKADRVRREGYALLLHIREVRRQNPREDLRVDLKEATTLYSLYLTVFPNDVEALVERAEIHGYRGAREDAVQDLRRAKELDPARANELDAKIQELLR